MSEILVVALSLTLNALLPYLIVRRDLRRLSGERLARAWTDASFLSAVVAFGPLCPADPLRQNAAFAGRLWPGSRSGRALVGGPGSGRGAIERRLRPGLASLSLNCRTPYSRARARARSPLPDLLLALIFSGAAPELLACTSAEWL